MSKQLSSENPERLLPPSAILRRNLVEKLEKLPDEGIAVLHDLAEELELRAAWSGFSAGMAADWAAGKYDQLETALINARTALRELPGS